MIIKEKRYIKKCDCGTEIIYTRRDCYHNTTWDIYSLYCPSCSHEYSYRRGTHHDLFDKEYEEDSVDKDEEIERLNNIINKKEQFLGDNIKRLEREVVKRDNIINELSKENQELKEKTKLFHKNRVFSLEYDKETLRDMVLEYQEKIDKAIEYINEYAWQEDIIGDMWTTTGEPVKDRYMRLEWDNCNELLEILKGEDKE